MVVRRKNSLDPLPLPVVQVLRHCPRDTQAIESARSSSDLVKNDQTFPGGVVENVGTFLHLDHESALSPGQVIRGAHTGKYAIYNPDGGFFGRHKGAHLRHKDQQGHLSQHGGFPGHVWSGDDEHLARDVIHLHGIRDKPFGGHQSLHHRMTAFFEEKASVFVDNGSRVIVLLRKLTQGSQDIDLRHDVRHLAEAPVFASHAFPYRAKEIIFQLGPFFFSAKDFRFIFLEIFGYVALSVDERLLAHVVRRH